MKGTLSHLLLDAGARHPDRIALVTGSERVTYGELCCRSGLLAAHLIEAGLRPGDRVVICLPKCVELSTAIFGTLFAGACYVPVDYTTPPPRAKLILRNSEPKVVICTFRMAHRLFASLPSTQEGVLGCQSGDQVFAFILDKPTSTADIHPFGCFPCAYTGDCDGLNSPVSVDSKAKAYILYTSGSTGRPKGVVHTHRSALAFVQWATDHLGLEAEDVLSQHASPSFDLTVFDFFCSAMAAASLVSIPEWMFGQVPKTCRFIAETGITVWYSVPSALLRGGCLTSLRGLSSSALRHVIFAGEVIPKKAINEFVRHLPSGCTVSNWYGPTETNVCTFHKIEATDLDLRMPVPIGIPCPYVQIRLCSKAKEKTETSGGELLVASETLMEGYWKTEQLTAKACTEEHDGQRYYKTGDVVSYDRGRLQFLGRKDRMLKIRGYRVQPEEIEQVLQAHANVSEAAAVIICDEGIDKLAAAVVVTCNLRDAVLADLERHCAEMLPRYMVPSTIILVESLPRGSRGKVDFEALSKLITLQPFPQQD